LAKTFVCAQKGVPLVSTSDTLGQLMDLEASGDVFKGAATRSVLVETSTCSLENVPSFFLRWPSHNPTSCKECNPKNTQNP